MHFSPSFLTSGLKIKRCLTFIAAYGMPVIRSTYGNQTFMSVNTHFGQLRHSIPTVGMITSAWGKDELDQMHFWEQRCHLFVVPSYGKWH
jgi:hypothetical protein